MTINLADNDPRNEYTVSDGNNQTVFTMDFEIFDNADLNVYVDNVKQTLTTHYKISDSETNANAGHTSGTDGFVHFTSAVTASGADKKIVLTRSIVLQRTTDFPASGAFQIGSLNTELDRIVAIQADLKDDIDRSLRLTDSDVDVALTLPNVDTRKGKTLAFNATTGVVEAGPTISGVTTVSAMAADIATLADIEDGTVATDAISNVNAVRANVTTVAGISSNVTTVAGISSDISTVVANITDIQNAEGHAQEAKDYATKVNAQVQENGVNTGNYSSKAWAVGGTGVTDASGAGAAKEWAVDQSADGVDGTEYSAKEYAIGSTAGNTNGSAKQWALGGGSSYSSTTTVDGANYSARYWAEKAESYVQQNFENKYLGAHSSNPTQDPYDEDPSDSQALDAGDLYFNTANNILRVYDGANWNDAVVDTTGFATNGFAIAMAIAL